jgi:tRNA(Ile)-lysidine synthase
MASLGPFGPAPRLAAGVSGGPDSLALAVLTDEWVRGLGGSLLALIVDHGLRTESGVEAAQAAARLEARGIAARVLRIDGLVRGPALAERARKARLAALVTASAGHGILHLLLGHHAGDQAETVLIRSLGGSGPAGLAGMAALVETQWLRILRPLLAVPPARLRATLLATHMPWAEDPSNADRAALRPRLRQLRGDRAGGGTATAALIDAAAAAGRQRADSEANVAAVLAERASLRPEGYGVLSAGPVMPAALSALLQTIGGAAFPPPGKSVGDLAAMPRPATLAGVRLLPAGRLGPGFLLVREAAAMAPDIPAMGGGIWDGRFRIDMPVQLPPGATLGALGSDAARMRRISPLPAAVLRALPAIRLGPALLAVPHLAYPDPQAGACCSVVFCPPRSAAAAAFQVANAFGDA